MHPDVEAFVREVCEKVVALMGDEVFSMSWFCAPQNKSDQQDELPKAA